MKYEMILQWPVASIEDYDRVIEIEELLIDNLQGNCEVDGHDGGSGEMNIFIFTNEPAETFNEIRTLLENHCAWDKIRVAYRAVKETRHIVLWPSDLHDFHVV